MKKIRHMMILVLLLVTAAFLYFKVYAATTGTYETLSYSLYNGEITIIDCDKDAIGTINIPYDIAVDGIYYPVTKIDDEAFYNCQEITGISMPSSVTQIGDYAFAECRQLSWIGFPEQGITEIPAYMCYGCESLKQISIPQGIQTIGDNAFYGCNLTEIYIPKSVQTIGKGAFRSYSNNRNVYIEDLTAWCEIDFQGAYASPLRSMTAPANGSLWINGEFVSQLVIPQTESITTIPQETFAGCGSIITVMIPDTVSVIEAGAFSGCSNLQMVTMTGEMAEIGASAFLECTALSTINIPRGITKLSDWIFQGCTALTSVSIPDTVTEIGHAAFQNCVGLTDITIPESVTAIGDSAFLGCDGLTEVAVPESVQTIGSYAFYKCDNLKKITIAEGITAIEDAAFQDCTSLTSITIPKSAASLGEYLFKGCNALNRIYAPVALKDGGNYWSYPLDSKIRYYCTIAYEGKYQGTDMVIYGEDAALPVLKYSASQHYSFVNQADKTVWDGTNVTEDMDITVHIETNVYTVTYQGDYNGSATVRHGGSVALPENPEGGKFVFYVNGKEWSGEKITDHVTVDVSTVWDVYTITYTGEYNGTDTVEHGKNVVLPVCSKPGYEYHFIQSDTGTPWDGTNVTSDVSVTVMMQRKACKITYVDKDGNLLGTVIALYEAVVDAEYSELDAPPEGYHYTYTKEGGSPWQGGKITEDVIVTVTTEINTYTVTYVGVYNGSDTATHGGSVTLPENPVGYTYTFTTADGEAWNGSNITGDMTVTVTKTINTYTVTYVGAYNGNDTATHGGSVTLPENPVGYTYTFTTADGEAWNGSNITGDMTVTVTKTINVYTVTYVGAYNGSDITTHGGSVTLPENPVGYTYIFTTADGDLWEGSDIIEDITVTVTKVPKEYTVTYTGAYTGESTVAYAEDAILPVAPDGYVYTFAIADGTEWNGEHITGNVTVTVTKLHDECELISASTLNGLTVTDEGAVASSYNAYLRVEDVTVSEGATVELYESAAYDIPVSQIFIPRDTAMTKCHLLITAQSGRSRKLSLAITREVVTELGEPVFESAIGSLVTLHLTEKIPGLPELIAYYSLNGENWTAAETIYNAKTGQILANLPWENTEYSIKVAANYGDLPYAESGIIGSVRTGEILSNACEIYKVYDVDDTKINAEMRSITGKVASTKAQISLKLDVSEGAAWKLYADKAATVLLEDKTLVLTEGESVTAYIKVTAEDGYNTKTYSITIYRQKKSGKPTINVRDGLVTVEAPEGSIIWYTTDAALYPIPGFVGRQYAAPFAVADGMVVKVTACAPDCEEYSDMVGYVAESPFTYAASILALEETTDGILWQAALEGAPLTDGICYFSAYNAKGVLLGVQSKPVLAESGTTEFSGTLYLTEKPAYCRVYFWNTQMKSLSACADYPLK